MSVAGRISNCKRVLMFTIPFVLVSSATGALNSDRIQQIAEMLPQKPSGFGVPCSNRKAWEPLAEHFSEQVKQATSQLNRPIPPWDNDAYLEFSKTGDRVRGENMLRSRQTLLPPLVSAECAEGQGKFVPRIAALLDSLSNEPSWTYPAHDPKLDSYSGRQQFVELNSAALANMVAETLFLLGDSLPQSTRYRTMKALEYHVFSPMRKAYATGEGESWMQVSTNWNPVCLGGVTGAALAVLPDRADRALFVAGAEHYYTSYLAGFPKDGYANEGIGYWNLGMIAFSEMREQIWQSTKGKIELFNDPLVRQVALFGIRFQMLPRVVADFGDAPFMQPPNPALLVYLESVFEIAGRGSAAAEPQNVPPQNDLVMDVMMAFPIHSQIHPTGSGAADSAQPGLRTYFTDTEVLVCRPADSGQLAVTIKAGGNTTHSHNDIGSFAVGLGDTQPLGDPGGPQFYTAATFSNQRLQSPLLNSYGHPVPVIAGQLQLDASKVKAPVLATSFKPDVDSIEVDMTPAYNVPALQHLHRTMSYSRANGGAIDIVDDFDLKAPTAVEEALPTHGTWRQIDAKTIEFTFKDQRLRVVVAAPYPVTIAAKQISDLGNSFTRVGLTVNMHSSGSIKLHISAAP